MRPKDQKLNADLFGRRLGFQPADQIDEERRAHSCGATDLDHLQYASRNGLVLLTANVSDFLTLHCKWIEAKLQHSGILIVYRENNPVKDLTVGQISKAVTEIERSSLPLMGALYDLNSWRTSPKTT